MTKKILINIVLNAAALYVTALFLDFIGTTGGIATYIYAGLIIGGLNVSIKPLLNLITFPIKILSLGLSLGIINAAIIYIADLLLFNFFGLEHDIIIQNDLVSYIKVGMLFGAFNWLEHLIVK